MADQEVELTRRLETIARHEAGHCVVAWAHLKHVPSIEIGDTISGTCISSMPAILNPFGLDVLRKMGMNIAAEARAFVRISMAGRAAERAGLAMEENVGRVIQAAARRDSDSLPAAFHAVNAEIGYMNDTTHAIAAAVVCGLDPLMEIPRAYEDAWAILEAHHKAHRKLTALLVAKRRVEGNDEELMRLRDEVFTLAADHVLNRQTHTTRLRRIALQIVRKLRRMLDR